MIGARKFTAYRTKLTQIIVKIAEAEIADPVDKNLVIKLNQRKTKIECALRTRGALGRVSDHARIRYLERVIGLDISELDEDILKAEDHKNIYRDGRIVTVVSNDQDKNV